MNFFIFRECGCVSCIVYLSCRFFSGDLSLALFHHTNGFVSPILRIFFISFIIALRTFFALFASQEHARSALQLTSAQFILYISHAIFVCSFIKRKWTDAVYAPLANTKNTKYTKSHMQSTKCTSTDFHKILIRLQIATTFWRPPKKISRTLSAPFHRIA